MAIANVLLLSKFGFLLDIVQLVAGNAIVLIGLGVLAAVVLILYLVGHADNAREARENAAADAARNNSSHSNASASSPSGGISLDK